MGLWRDANPVAALGGRDGQSGIHTGMTNTRNTPVEALERAFPLRVRRYRLRSGSGGEGRYSGGEGVERDLEVLENVTVSLITERRASRPGASQAEGPAQSARTGCFVAVMRTGRSV